MLADTDQKTLSQLDLVAVRPYLESSDKSFILATWLRGLYYGESWFSKIDKATFMRFYHDVLTRVLDHSATQVRVACLKDDPETILGYAVTGYARKEPGTIAPIVHWVHVKANWRNVGIAKTVVPPGTFAVTHLSRVGACILDKHPEIAFNPFLL